MDETKRTLELKLGLTMLQTAHFLRELEIHFADAWVKGDESIFPTMTNHPKDRYVLAAAVVCEAQTIVTFNLKDSQTENLAPWNMEVQSPDQFLVHQYHLDPATVLAVVTEQAAPQGGWERLMGIHSKIVPGFVSLSRITCC